jgi:hypothetical protein
MLKAFKTLTRNEAPLMVDRAMVRIRRSQSRRTIGHLMRQRLGRRINLGGIAVADALQKLSETDDQEPTIGRMAERLGIDPSRARRMTAGAISGRVREKDRFSIGRPPEPSGTHR